MTVDPRNIPDHPSFVALARDLGCANLDSKLLRDRLAKTPIYLAGFGSIARPLSERLAAAGAVEFALADPKRYQAESVASQCEPHEVGRLKVDVGAECLRRRGARVSTFARDIYAVPAGAVSAQSVVVASVDNRRADIRANRIAAAMQARLVKVNIEPAYETVSIRSYAYGDSVSICAECQFTARQYQQQRHPQSCDGAMSGRRTNSPRGLSQAAGCAGALAVAAIMAGPETAQRWIGREVQLQAGSGKSRVSELVANPKCRYPHNQVWHHVQRINSTDQREGCEMNAIWRKRKQANAETVHAISARSPVFTCLEVQDCDDEWRMLGRLETETLVLRNGEVDRDGPIYFGLRYHQRHLAEAPHPFEMVSILSPRGVFLPNCNAVGALCMGHPVPGVSVQLLINQVWAAVNFNMKFVSTVDVANWSAAEYVRANVKQFPLSEKGLFEHPESVSRNHS